MLERLIPKKRVNNVTRLSLCQPNRERSCAACCGVYNDTGTRDDVMREVQERTREFRSISRPLSVDSLKSFRKKWEKESGQRLMAELQNCPFVGFLDGPATSPGGRMGCMVHPLQNQGFDGRDCGVFDRHICEDYLCASYSVLSNDEKTFILSLPLDAYTYGLVITDPMLIKRTLSLVATELGSSPQLSRTSESFRTALAEFFEFKHTWPWREPDANFGPLKAGKDLETPRRSLPLHESGLTPDPVDDLLICFGSAFPTSNELVEARDMVHSRIVQLASILVNS